LSPGDGAPPRIHTLRNAVPTPPTSDCFTPRTLEGNAAAFKNAKYGSSIEGPYRREAAWIGWLAWVGTVVLAVLAGVLLLTR